MNADIRLKVTFPNHHKIKKLYRRLGPQGPLSLIYLWLYVAENKPNGVLSGMDEEDIELAAQWNGDAGVMLVALLDLCLLHKQADAYSVHDWKDNNPYAFHAPIRSERAKKGAEARWKKHAQNQDVNASSMPVASTSNAPSPSPSPSPKEKPLSEFEIKRNRFFEDLWDAYPKDGRVKKKEALRHYLASVKTAADFPRIDLALGAYIDHLKANDWKKPQNGSTWFNNWTDWEVADAQ